MSESDDEIRVAHATQLAEHIRRVVLPQLTSRRDLPARHYAAAALARCNRLLLGMIDLRAQAFPDVVGVLLRPFVECWYLGTYFVLAPDAAYQETHAAHAFQLRRLDPNHWPGADVIANQMPESPSPMNWKEISDTIGDLFELRGHEGMRETTDWLYKTLYQGESAMSIHAGAAVLIGHFDDTAPARFGTLEVRLEPDDGIVRIRMAAPLLETLARAVCGTFGVSYVEIDRLGRLLAPPA